MHTAHAQPELVCETDDKPAGCSDTFVVVVVAVVVVVFAVPGDVGVVMVSSPKSSAEAAVPGCLLCFALAVSLDFSDPVSELCSVA